MAIAASAAQAGTTGKLSGRITTTGKKKEPLAGRQRRRRWACRSAPRRDVDGRFTILNIPAGKISVKVSLIGYGIVTTQDVEINADNDHAPRRRARRERGPDEGSRGERAPAGRRRQPHEQHRHRLARAAAGPAGAGAAGRRQSAGRRRGRPLPRRPRRRGAVPGRRRLGEQRLRQQVLAPARPLAAGGGAGHQRHVRRRVRPGHERRRQRGAQARHARSSTGTPRCSPADRSTPPARGESSATSKGPASQQNYQVTLDGPVAAAEDHLPAQRPLLSRRQLDSRHPGLQPVGREPRGDRAAPDHRHGRSQRGAARLLARVVRRGEADEPRAQERRGQLPGPPRRRGRPRRALGLALRARRA